MLLTANAVDDNSICRVARSVFTSQLIMETFQFACDAFSLVP